MSDNRRPWYLRAFVAICAWFTALFFMFWIFAFFRDSKEGVAFFGVFLLVGASLLGRALRDSDFLEHTALACALAGRAAAAYGFGETIHSQGTVFGILALAEGVWFILNPNFSFRLISVCSGFLFLGGFLHEAEKGTEIWMPLLIAGALVPLAFVWLPGRWKDFRTEVWRPLGWAAVLVLGLWSIVGGDWFLMGRDEVNTYIASGALALLLCGFTAWLLRDSPREATVVLPLLLVLAWTMGGNPSVMAGLLLGLVGFRSRENKITALAAATLLAGMVSYYYHLNDTLLYKSGVLAVSGFLFAAAAVWFSGGLKTGSSGASPAASGQGKIRALAALAILAFTCAVVDFSANQAEGLKASGDEVYLQLRPRDPRDPLMGDYMAVNFLVCNDIATARSGKPGLSSTGFAWMRRDEKKVLWFDSLDEGSAKPGLLRIRYQESEDRISLGTTKVYFQEGDEPRFRVARYGRFKLQPDGTLTWIGFADVNLKAL